MMFQTRIARLVAAVTLLLAGGRLSAQEPPANAALPPGALMRICSNELQTTSFVSDFAFSPDGKLIAAAESNSPVPLIVLFDVESGREVERISVQPAKPDTGGWIECVAFSPDQSRLIWGEVSGHVAVWDLQKRSLVLREKKHQGGVLDVEVSADGATIGSIGADGAVYLRNGAKPAEILKRLSVTGDRSQRAGDFAPSLQGCLAFTPDGSRFVVGDGSTGILSIWSVADGKRIRTIDKAHVGGGSFGAPLVSVAVSPDGKRIISSGQHTVPIEQTKVKAYVKNLQMTEVRVWDIESGQRLIDVQGDDDAGNGFSDLSRDGQRIAVAEFRRLRILNAADGASVRTILLPEAFNRQPRFSPDGRVVALPMDTTIALFDVETGERLNHDPGIPDGGNSAANWSSDGQRIVTGHNKGTVCVWDLQAGKLVWSHLLAPVIDRIGRTANPAFVAFTPDDKFVVVAGRRDDPVNHLDGIVAVYDARDGQKVREVFLEQIREAALSPDGKTIVATSSYGSVGDTRVHGIDIESGQILYVVPPLDKNAPDKRGLGIYQPKAMRFRPGTNLVELACQNSKIKQFDARSGLEMTEFFADFRTPVQMAANRPSFVQLWEGDFSCDAKTLVTCAENTIYIWDVEQGKLTFKFQHPHAKGCRIGVSPDGKRFATSDLMYVGDPGENLIRIFDTQTGKELRQLNPGDDRINNLVFSPDGTKLFTGCWRRSMLIWDVK